MFLLVRVAEFGDQTICVLAHKEF